MVAIFTGSGLGLAQGSANILGGAGQLGAAGLGRGGDQVAVNAATGNLVITRQDEFLAGIGLDASVSRVFNSGSVLSDDRDNGDGWQQSSTKRIYGLTGTANSAGSTLLRQDADGSIITYAYATRGGVAAYWTTAGSGAHDKITQSGGNWVWTDGESQVSETYGLAYGSSTDYRIASAATLGARTVSYTYLANSNLIDKIITYNNGGRADEYLQYTWSGNTITKIETGYVDFQASDTFKTLTRTYYEYTSGKLTKVRTDLTPGDNTTPNDTQSYWTSYGYDGSGRVNLITQKDGSSLAIAYDGSGRVTTLTQKETASVNRVTTITYDASGTFTSITAPYSSGVAADYTTKLYYDANKQLTKIVAPPASSGATPQEVTFSYDADGNVDLVTNADGEVTDYDYDTFGNATKVTRLVAGGTNIVVDRTYDSNNRLTRESWTSVFEGATVGTTQYKRYVYGSSTKLEWEIDADGLVREYVIDSGLREAVWVNEYVGHTYATGSGVPSATTMVNWRNGLGDLSSRRSTYLIYDKRGNVDQTVSSNTHSSAGDINWAEVNYNWYDYDQAGQMTFHQRNGENAQTYQYDGMGRMTASVDVLGGTTSIVFNDSTSQTEVTTSLNRVVTKTYNLAGDLISETGSYAGSASNVYDKQGRLRYSIDESGDKSYFVYDKAGRLVATINHLGELTEYQYDNANRVIATVRYYTRKTTYLSQLAVQSSLDNYSIGTLRPATNAADVWAWTVYDNAGRVVQTIDGDGNVVESDYDTSGNVLRTVAYFEAVDTAALKTTPPLTKVTVTADPAKDVVTRMFYDRSGRLRATLNGEGYLSEAIYDRAGQVVETVAYEAKANSTLWATGTLSALRTDVGASSAANRRVRFVYDNMGLLRFQLDYVSRSGSNNTWQVTQMTYDTTQRLTQTTVRANAVTISNSSPNFSLSAVTALITTSSNDRSATNTYTFGNQVASTTDASGLTSWFTYDVAGNVIKTVTGTGVDQRITRAYYASSGHLLYVVDADGYVSGYNYENDGLTNLARRYSLPVTVSDATTTSQLAALLVGATSVDVSTTYDNADRSLVVRNGLNQIVSDTRYVGTGLVSDVYRATGTTDEARESFTYTTAGRLATAKAGVGEANALDQTAYNGLGLVSTATDARANATSYTYDRRGLVLTASKGGSTTTYEYNAFGEVVKATDARGFSSYSYYDNLGRTTMVLDAEGYVDTFAYNRFGDVTSHTRYADTVWQASYAVVQQAFDYATQLQNTANSLAAQASADAATAASLQQQANDLYASAASYLASAQSYQSQVTSLNSTLTQQYNAFWAGISGQISSLQSQIAALQAQIDYYYQQAQYDPYNAYYYALMAYPLEQERNGLQSQVYSLQQMLANQSSYPIGSALPDPAYTSTLASRNAAQANADAAMANYNSTTSAANTKQSQANAAATTASQSSASASAAQTSANQALASAQSQLAVWQASTATPPTTINTGTLGAAATTSFTYNAAGQLTRTTDATNFYEDYTYTQFGERATVAAKSETSTAADGANNITAYKYNKRGLLIETETPQILVNGTNQKIKTTYTYDGRGNRLTMTEAVGLAEARTTAYTYDLSDRLTKTVSDNARTVYSQANFLSLSTTFKPEELYEYDQRGNLIKVTDAMGNWSVFFYDDMDRKTAEIDVGGTYTSYTYDANSNVTNIKVYENLVVSLPATGGNKAAGAALAPTGNKRDTSFAYDALNRMTSSTVVLASGYRTGTLSGSTWSNTNTTGLTTTYEYDANGNVVKTTDPNGNSIYAYYDKVGRKIAQVDAENGLTRWTYNAEGNVTEEYRFANRVGLQNGHVATTSSTLQQLVDSALYNLDDRITVYGYDLAGNRLHEGRYNVQVFNPATNGQTAPAGSHAWVVYTYNGLGQVLTRTEASGDVTGYTYDNAGRLLTEVKPGYLDQVGVTVTPMVNYTYDGLGNLKTLTAEGKTNPEDRVTTYTYGAGGLLASVTDADGKTHQYYYDKLGRQLVDQYVRYESNGTTNHTEANLTSYDAKGQVTESTHARLSGGVWSKGDISSTAYNAFGDVIATGVNVGSALPSAWQSQNRYDLAGRLWATSSSDGLWKYFGYDKNGNQTITVTSGGASIASVATGGTYSYFTTSAFSISSATVNATYTVYDKRGLATQVTEEQREINAGAAQTLNTSRSYNSFGEVVSETNAAGATVNYTYNTMGKMIRSEGPTVQMTKEDGTTHWIRPSEDYYYDKSGRLVAQRDANGTYASGGTPGAGTSKTADTGNLTRLTLLAGTGYGGSEALVTHETHADGGIKQTKYDIHGNARVLIDEENRTLATNTYDKLGRLTSAVRLGGLTDTYTYDILGQQLTHWNSLNGSGNKETSDYDRQGRLVSTRAFGGLVTNYGYTWDGTLEAAGTGLTDTGGWVKTTSYVNNGVTLTFVDGTTVNRDTVEKTDIFGRAVEKSNLANQISSFTYDLAGRLTQTGIAATASYYNYEYYNTGQVKRAYTTAPGWDYYTSNTTSATAGSFSASTTQSATYTYDLVGNRLTEVGTLSSGATNISFKNHTATYDALGRLTSVVTALTNTHQASNVSFTYDAGGNVRSKTAAYQAINASGGYASSLSSGQTSWYRYDNMNRVVINNGTFAGGQITRGAPVSVNYIGDPSQEFTYNKAGQRTTAITSQYYTASVYIGNTPYGPINQTVTYYYAGYVQENYTYDANGRLFRVHSGETGFDAQGYWDASMYAFVNGLPAPAEGLFVIAPSSITKRAEFYYDTMGRQTTQYGYAANGTTQIQQALTSYDAAGQVATTNSFTVKTDNKTYSQSQTNDYGTGNSYALGAVISSTGTSGVTGQSTKNTSTTNTFVWRDSALQNTTTYDSDTGSGSNPLWTTTFTYNGLGQMTKAGISDGKPRTVTFTLDEVGQIIRRDETNFSGQTGAPHEVWFRLADREIGYLGNNGYDNPTMSGSLAAQQVVSPGTGTFRNSTTTSTSAVGYAQALDAINVNSQGSRSSGYTVRAGDDLKSIARQLYGDAGLWYKIAEVNGLSGSSVLNSGQQIQLPSGVTRNTYKSDSYRPYDPSQVMGDLSPTSAAVPKKPKCGVFGMILLAAVSIAVTALTAGSAAAALGPVLGGAVSGAAGAVASQVVGVATGIQEKFSFKAVAMAAISGAIGGALNGAADGAKGLFSKVGIADDIGGSQFLGNVIRGATSSAITQGIGVATGLQDKFSFAGVAAAGVASGVSGALGTEKLTPLSGAGLTMGNAASHLAAGAASLLASAATRSVIEGSSFGESIMAGLPDVIGQVVGRALGSALERAVSVPSIPNGPNCFVGGTIVQTNLGPVEIELLKVGDRVWSRNQNDPDADDQLRVVLETFKHEKVKIYIIEFRNEHGFIELIKTTQDHLFFEKNRGWVPASDLRKGDLLSGGRKESLLIEESYLSATIDTVYNFSVDVNHTYFISNSKIWVHNDYEIEANGRSYRVAGPSEEGIPLSEYIIDMAEAERAGFVEAWIGRFGLRPTASQLDSEFGEGLDNEQYLLSRTLRYLDREISPSASALADLVDPGFSAGIESVANPYLTAASDIGVLVDGVDLVTGMPMPSMFTPEERLAASQRTSARVRALAAGLADGIAELVQMMGDGQIIADAAYMPPDILNQALARNDARAAAISAALGDMRDIVIDAYNGSEYARGVLLGNGVEFTAAAFGTKGLGRIRVLSVVPDLPRIGSYKSLRTELSGTNLQANHLNQDAAFRDVISRDDGLAIEMRGNAFSDVDSPHYQFHAALEEFWNPYRSGGNRAGELPTNGEYGEALERGLIRSGQTPDAARIIAERASQQRIQYGLMPNDPVPRVPGRTNQSR